MLLGHIHVKIKIKCNLRKDFKKHFLCFWIGMGENNTFSRSCPRGKATLLHKKGLIVLKMSTLLLFSDLFGALISLGPGKPPLCCDAATLHCIAIHYNGSKLPTNTVKK